MDNSAKKLAPKRSIVIEKDTAKNCYHLIAIEERPEGGRKQTLLNSGNDLANLSLAELTAEATSRCVQALTGVTYTYDGYFLLGSVKGEKHV